MYNHLIKCTTTTTHVCLFVTQVTMITHYIVYTSILPQLQYVFSLCLVCSILCVSLLILASALVAPALLISSIITKTN